VTDVTGDQHLVKKINKSILLDWIRRASPVSRADLSVRTGLNKGTVSSLVRELIESGLVRELGPGPSSGGRKPILLAFDPDAGAAVGVDIGVHHMAGVLTDLAGNVKIIRRVSLPDRSYPAVVEQTVSLVKKLSEDAKNRPYGVVGVGVGVPGLVDADGTVLFAPNLEWENRELRTDLADALGSEIYIDNEANLGAIAERRFGAGDPSDFCDDDKRSDGPRTAAPEPESVEMIYISAGIGIGAGLIVNGALYRGAVGLSGEAGHMTVETEGRPCPCGNRGCWEQYASEQALIREARAVSSLREALDGRPGEELETLTELARAGNADAATLFRRTGAALGVGIANLIHIFNPERVVVGNRLTLAEEWLLDAIREEVGRRTMPFHRRRVDIRFSRLGVHATALGAAWTAVERFFADMRITVKA